MGIMVIFITGAWEWKTGTLGCFPLYERHTYENLKESILNFFNDFSIDLEKLTCMITDGETAIKKAAKDIVG